MHCDHRSRCRLTANHADASLSAFFQALIEDFILRMFSIPFFVQSVPTWTGPTENELSDASGDAHNSE